VYFVGSSYVAYSQNRGASTVPENNGTEDENSPSKKAPASSGFRAGPVYLATSGRAYGFILNTLIYPHRVQSLRTYRAVIFRFQTQKA